MSEYHYYEFQTVDRRLSVEEMQELRSYSTRPVITPTSFSNEYSFGSFKGNPNAWKEEYFDGYVYLANWGTHELRLALQDLAVQHLLDLRDLAVRKGEETAFSGRLVALREAHSRKPSFIGRLQDKGLGS